MKIGNIFTFILDNLDKLPMVFAYFCIAVMICAVVICTICALCQIILEVCDSPRKK